MYSSNITKDYEVCISIFDTEREKDYEVGRSYEFPPLEFGECNVNEKYEASLGVKPGDLVYYNIPFSLNMNNILVKYDRYAIANGKRRSVYRSRPFEQNTDQINFVSLDVNIKMPCRVKRLTSGTYGKFPDANTGNILMMEYQHFLRHLSYYLPDDYNNNQDFIDYLRDPTKVTMYEFADVFIMQLPSPRTSYYESSDYDEIQRRVTLYAN